MTFAPFAAPFLAALSGAIASPLNLATRDVFTLEVLLPTTGTV